MTVDENVYWDLTYLFIFTRHRTEDEQEEKKNDSVVWPGNMCYERMPKYNSAMDYFQS